MILPQRSGVRPRTTDTNPHTQLDQNPSASLVDALCVRLFALSGVIEQPSAVSVPGARALWLLPENAKGPREAFMIWTEFAHVHPMPDGSLHVALPPDLAEEVIRQGWGEPHPAAKRGLIPANVCMVYAPRDENEIEIVAGLVEETLQFASGR
ncbi:MAG: phospholipase [Candidatus Manganitrophaceae bacterium]|nr:MAG: phospholipase [Candidatus Manganitrophaceae bacterium]